MVVVVSLMGASAFAQDEKFRLGVVGGLEISKSNGEIEFSYKADDRTLSGTEKETLSDRSKLGFKMGVIGEYNLNESLALTSGLVFTQRGGKKEEKESEGSYSTTEKATLGINYLQIPINVKLYHPINDDMKVFGFAGHYIAFGLSGKIKWESTTK